VTSPLRLSIPSRYGGTRFDRALAELVPDQTRAQLQKLVRRGRVKLDGKKVLRSNLRLNGGEELLVHLPAPEAPPPTVDWIHVTDDYAVADKPAGLLTHATPKSTRTSQPTLADAAVARFGVLPTIDEDFRPGIVHRLDRDTSGLVVIARTERALEHLRARFRAREVDKRYLALVHGVPTADTFASNDPIAPHPSHQDLQRVAEDGRASHTSFEVLRRFASHALVECHPTTGRRHQLRVHLHALGHPIVADELYRPPRSVDREPKLPHHALHASHLAFDALESAERVAFDAAPHPWFREALDALA